MRTHLIWRGQRRHLPANCGTKLANPSQIVRAPRAAGEVVGDAPHTRGVQLTVGKRIQEGRHFITRHDRTPSPARGPNTSRSRRRARARRDITVPTGTPTTVAISLYE